MNKIKLTKIEQKFKEDAKKIGVSFSNKKIKEYHEKIKKANRKLNRLKKDSSYVGDYYGFNFSATNLNSKKQFSSWEKAVDKVLNRNFKRNQYTRSIYNIEKNLTNIYGSDIKIELNPSQLNKFIKENKILSELTNYKISEKYKNTIRLIYDKKEQIETEIEYYGKEK